jgi:hypothetical protein
MRKSSPQFAPQPKGMKLSRRFAGGWFLSNRLPELCGIAWLLLLAGAIWLHTHVSMQTPIYDAFTYYEKADNFWAAVHAGTWFNPLNVVPSFRPPGTVLMSYPFGFSVNPRPFYFRSVYLPALLLFAAVCIVAYDAKSDAQVRWRIVLTAMFFTSMTLAFQFEYGSGRGFWGLVDSFLAGIAAVAGACAWRGTSRSANRPAWAIATCVFSVLAIIVKPSGAMIAVIAGLAWVVFGLATLVEYRRSGLWQNVAGRRLILKLLLGAVIIAVGDGLMVDASLKSGYLSPQNMAFGRGAIALMRQMPFSASLLWPLLNGGLGRGLLYWAVLAALICAIAAFSGRSIVKVRGFAAMFVCTGTVVFGVWFWFIGSAAPQQVRYAVPFFMMALVWLIPVIQLSWEIVPALLRLVTVVVMLGTVVNLALLLLLPRPALAWQRFSGVGITADFPPDVLSAFKRFVAEPSDRARSVYVVSFDVNDAILGSVIDESQLLHPDRQVLSLRRPIDWQRSATIRLNEVGIANALMVAPPQCVALAPEGRYVANRLQEQGVFTCWADGLTGADGVAVYLATPTVKILSVVDPAKFRESLERMVASYTWDPTFATANFGPDPD